MSGIKVARFAGYRDIQDLNAFLNQPNVRYVDLKISEIRNRRGESSQVLILIYEEDDGIIRGGV